MLPGDSLAPLAAGLRVLGKWNMVRLVRRRRGGSLCSRGSLWQRRRSPWNGGAASLRCGALARGRVNKREDTTSALARLLACMQAGRPARYKNRGRAVNTSHRFVIALSLKSNLRSRATD